MAQAHPLPTLRLRTCLGEHQVQHHLPLHSPLVVRRRRILSRRRRTNPKNPKDSEALVSLPLRLPKSLHLLVLVKTTIDHLLRVGFPLERPLPPLRMPLRLSPLAVPPVQTPLDSQQLALRQVVLPPSISRSHSVALPRLQVRRLALALNRIPQLEVLT